MAFREEVEVLLLTESHVVEHIKGVELEIVSDKLISLTQRLKIAQEMVEEHSAIIVD
ncbi:hypothetical protein ACEC18_004452 [Vibrio parahaemolyticus]